jgi:hypothetical protein
MIKEIRIVEKYADKTGSIRIRKIENKIAYTSKIIKTLMIIEYFLKDSPDSRFSFTPNLKT